METKQDTNVEAQDLQTPTRESEAIESGLSRKLIRPRGEKVFRGQREAKLKAERVQEKLLAMPGWRLSGEGKGLVRIWMFRDNKTAMSFTDFANNLTEGSGHLAHITLSGRRVL